jgi:hypothetical protein
MEKNVKEDNDYYLHLQGDMYEGRNKVKSIRSIKGGDKRQRGDRRGHDLGSTFQDDAQTPRLGYTETEPMASFRGPSAKRRGLATYPSHTRPTLTANAFPSGIDPQWWRGLSRAEMKAGPGATRKEIDAADKKIKYREKRRKQGTTLWGNVEDNLREALYRQRNGMRMCGTREYLVSEDITPKTSEGEDTEDQRRIDCQGVALGVLRRPKLQRRLSMLDVARVSNNAGRDVHTELQSNG